MKRQKIFIAAMVAALVISTLASAVSAATPEPKFGGTLKIIITSVKSLDPVQTTSSFTRLVARHIFDTLFAWDAKGDPQPMMVEKWTASEDFKTFSFTLREGLLFHDGQPVTVEDVKASLERWGKKDKWGKTIFKLMEKFEKIDDRTFTIVMKEPYRLLPKALGKAGSPLPIIMPKELAATPPTKPVKKYIGSGPYKFAEWKPGRHVLLERFDGYKPRKEPASGFAGGKIAYADKLMFMEVPDVATQIAALETGEVDVVHMVSHDQVERLRQNKDISLHMIMPYSCSALVFNKTRPPFNNVKMRQAVQAATDVKEVMRLIVGSEEFFLCSPAIFFEGTTWASDVGKEKYFEADLAKGKALVKEAGGPPSDPIILLAPKDHPMHYNQSLAMKEVLEKLGFKVDYQLVDWATLMSKRSKKNLWDVFAGGFTLAANSEPATVVWLNPKWPGWYESPRMQELVQKYLLAKNSAEQRTIVDEMQSLYYEEVPILRIGDRANIRATRSNVVGPILSEAKEAVFWNVWFK